MKEPENKRALAQRTIQWIPEWVNKRIRSLGEEGGQFLLILSQGHLIIYNFLDYKQEGSNHFCNT